MLRRAIFQRRTDFRGFCEPNLLPKLDGVVLILRVVKQSIYVLYYHY
jgi:hypothetical protein